jgi:hypothetical protein
VLGDGDYRHSGPLALLCDAPIAPIELSSIMLAHSLRRVNGSPTVWSWHRLQPVFFSGSPGRLKKLLVAKLTPAFASVV